MLSYIIDSIDVFLSKCEEKNLAWFSVVHWFHDPIGILLFLTPFFFSALPRLFNDISRCSEFISIFHYSVHFKYNTSQMWWIEGACSDACDLYNQSTVWRAHPPTVQVKTQILQFIFGGKSQLIHQVSRWKIKYKYNIRRWSGLLADEMFKFLVGNPQFIITNGWSAGWCNVFLPEQAIFISDKQQNHYHSRQIADACPKQLW